MILPLLITLAVCHLSRISHVEGAALCVGTPLISRFFQIPSNMRRNYCQGYPRPSISSFGVSPIIAGDASDTSDSGSSSSSSSFSSSASKRSQAPSLTIKWAALGVAAIRIGVLLATCPPVGQLILPNNQQGAVTVSAPSTMTPASEIGKMSFLLLAINNITKSGAGFLASCLLSSTCPLIPIPPATHRNSDFFPSSELPVAINDSKQSNWLRRLADRNNQLLAITFATMQGLVKDSYPLLIAAIRGERTGVVESRIIDEETLYGVRRKITSPFYVRRILDGLMADQRMAPGIEEIAKAVTADCEMFASKQKLLDELLENVLSRVDRQLRLQQQHRQIDRFVSRDNYDDDDDDDDDEITRGGGQRKYIRTLHETLMISLETDGMALLKEMYKIKVLNTVKSTVNRAMFKTISNYYPAMVRETVQSLLAAWPLTPKLLMERFTATLLNSSDYHRDENDSTTNSHYRSSYQSMLKPKANTVVELPVAKPQSKPSKLFHSKLFRRRLWNYMLRAGVNGMICVLATLISSWSTLLSILIDRFMDSERVRLILLGHMELMLISLYAKYVSDGDLPEPRYALKSSMKRAPDNPVFYF